MRILELGPVDAGGTAVLLPGLCLPGYTLPTVRQLAAAGLRCLVVDALAWRSGRRRAAPRVAATVPVLAAATAAWLASAPPLRPLVLIGHSTGAQVALEAALLAQDGQEGMSLVMAGPTFRPEHRTVPRLGGAALTAYRRDSPRQLAAVTGDLARVRLDLLSIIRSARRHRPEARVAGLRLPLTLMAGEADSFAPASWLSQLAAASQGTPAVAVLPGSHNNFYTQPAAVAAAVSATLAGSTG
jgi:pimeloyl-ACP methyl ester carboxylesterase